MITDLTETIQKIRKNRPLVCCMTNFVAAPFTADALLALGASPIMFQSREEAEELVSRSSALLINIGTADSHFTETALIAGKTAKKLGIPLVFDPVGAGASSFRLRTSLKIIEETEPDIIKGNPGEIYALLGGNSAMKGTESTETDISPENICREAGKKFRCVCAITGKYDYVSRGEKVYELRNDCPMLTHLTGTGCVLGAFCGAFASETKDYAEASLKALAFMSISGEKAFRKSGPVPGDFRRELLNAFADTDIIQT